MIKLQQIHIFYEQYLRQFYQKNRHLTHAGFNEHVGALINDGFASIHMLAPHLTDLGYDTQLVIANCFSAQKQWAIEHDIDFNGDIYNNRKWIFEVTKKQIEYFKPDVLYISYPFLFASDFIRTLAWKPSLILGWCASLPINNLDWTAFNVMLSNTNVCLNKALSLGVESVEYFFPGFPNFIAEAVKNETQEYDVVFSGNCTLKHHKRIEYLEKIAISSLRNSNKYSVSYFIPTISSYVLPPLVTAFNNAPVWGIDMHRALKRGRIAVNIHVDDAKNEYGNMRIFEITGTGTFMLTDYKDNLCRYFELGREIETFKDEDELMEKIYYYLENTEEREAIARCGQKHCLHEYSMEKRAEDFNIIIKKYLLKKGNIICV